MAWHPTLVSNTVYILLKLKDLHPLLGYKFLFKVQRKWLPHFKKTSQSRILSRFKYAITLSIHCECDSGLLDFHCSSIILSANDEKKAVHRPEPLTARPPKGLPQILQLLALVVLFFYHIQYICKSLKNSCPERNQGWESPEHVIKAGFILMATF